MLTCIACILFADWLRGALTFGLAYLHTTSTLPNFVIANQQKVAYSKKILKLVTGTLSTSTLNERVSVDTTKALAFFYKNLDDRKINNSDA